MSNCAYVYMWISCTCVKVCVHLGAVQCTRGAVSMWGCAVVSYKACYHECVHDMCPGNAGCKPAAATSTQAAQEIRHLLAGSGVTETML